MEAGSPSGVYRPMSIGSSIYFLEAGGGKAYAADHGRRQHIQNTRISVQITHALRAQVWRGLAGASAHREGVRHGDEHLCPATPSRAGAEPPTAAAECLMVAASQRRTAREQRSSPALSRTLHAKPAMAPALFPG